MRMLVPDFMALALPTLVAFIGASGCSSADAGNNTSGNGNGAAGSGSAGGPTGHGGGGESISVGISSGAGCDVHCSADLHHVLDCNGQTIKDCPANQGCSPGGDCVPPCDAATANKSTIGCDFYSATPAITHDSRGSCFAVMIANTWTSSVAVETEYDGVSLDAAAYTYIPQGQGPALQYQLAPGGQIAPGQLGVVFLSHYESNDDYQIDCPVPPALTTSTQVDTTGRGHAFRITTTAPVVAYDVYPWGGAASYVTSATLLVPTPTWGTNVVTVDAWGSNSFGQPFTQIVGSEDGTTVTFVPSAAVQGGSGVPPMPANVPTAFAINRGEVVQIVQQERVAGSTLQSDKPVGVWGGHTCMLIPDENVLACDGAHQQLLAVQTLGNEYVGVRYPSRGGDDQAPYTMVGMVDGTALAYDPMPPGAPTTLNRGQVSVFSTDQPFAVKSLAADHPFYIAAHMTGAEKSGSILNGDPEFVNVVPSAQFLAEYLFVTDPTYAYTALALARKKDEQGNFHDVTLDCMGPVTGWVPVGTSGDYEVARPLIVDGGVGVGACNNGVHTAKSDAPFGLTVWGYDHCASYAYPAGMSVQPINTVVIPPRPK